MSSEASRSDDTESEIQKEQKNIADWLNAKDSTGGIEDKDKITIMDKITIVLADYERGNEWVDKGQNVTYITGNWKESKQNYV